VPTTVQLVDDPRHAALLAAPIRRRILAAMDEPGSATTLAKSLRLPRQLVAYHVRQLEAGGYLELVREERRRGCVERIVQRTARYLVAAPDVLSAQGIDPRAFKDRFSSGYLIALATRMAREVADAQAAADRAGRPLATLSAEVEVRFRSPAERQAFADELLQALTRLVEKYHHADFPDGRSYRVVLGAHPIRPSRRKA
jgi:hypothetical protein